MYKIVSIKEPFQKTENISQLLTVYFLVVNISLYSAK